VGLEKKKERRIYFLVDRKKKEKCKRVDGIKTGVQTREAISPIIHPFRWASICSCSLVQL
jgi:hypothetical protein